MTGVSVLDIIENYSFKVRKGYKLTNEDREILKEIQTMFWTSGFSRNSGWALKVTELLSEQ